MGSTPPPPPSSREALPPDSLRCMAAALVTHTPLNDRARASLEQAFPGVGELRLVLANGESEILECFSLMQDGVPSAEPLVCACAMPPRGGSAAYECMKRGEVVEVGPDTPERDGYADWCDLAGQHGATWLMAVPLSCPDNHAISLVGAVLAAGGGPRPTVSPSWLREWACEMAKTLAHASVQLMETSLDMLHVIFPPKVLEQLLLSAVQHEEPVPMHQALALASAHAVRGAPAALAAQAQAAEPAPAQQGPGLAQHSSAYHPVVLEARVQDEDSQLMEDARTSPFAALVVASSGSGELGRGDLFAPPPPFPSSPERSASLASPAARRTESCPRQSSEFLPSAGGSGGTAGGNGGTAGGNGGTGLLVGSGAALPGSAARSASVSSHCSLARQASIASSAAAALLRQASLQSDVSFLFDDADSNLVASPHSSEVEGFEDLLHEDAVQHAQCRSSFSGLPPPSPPPGSPQHDNAASMGNSTAQLATPTTTPVDSPVASPHGVPTSPPSPLSFHSPSGSPTAAAAAASSPAAQRGRAGERAAAAPGSASLGAAQRPPVPRRAPSPAASRLGPPLEQLGTLLGPSVLTKAPGSPSAAGGRAGGGALRPLLLPATAGAVTATAASRLAEHAKHAERAAAAAAAASGDEPPATPFALEPWAPTATPPPTVQGGTGESGSSDRQAQQAQQPVFYNTPLESIREASLSSLSSLASLASSRLGSPPGPSERMESSAMERMESVIEEVVNSGLASSSVAGGSGPLGGSVAGGSGPLGSGSGSDSKLGAEGGAATAAPASAGGREAAAAEPARPLPSDSSAGGSGSSSGRKSPGEAVAVESAVGSSQPAAGGTVRPRGKRSGRHTASAPSQRWDLTYTDAALESAYRDWVGPRLLSHDRIIACAYAAAAAITLLALAMRRAATWELLALHLAGCALFLTPGLAASLPSSAAHRDSHRSGWLSGLRLATVLLYAASMVLGGPASGSQAPAPVLCMLWRTFVPCMVMGALRHLLPCAAHVPVQLLSLWVGTATLGLLGSQAGPCCGALPMPAGLAGQVLLGFALPTLLVYLHEWEERRLFWGQWDGAAGGAHEHQE